MATEYFTAEPMVNTNAAAPSEDTSLTLAYCTYGSPYLPVVMMPTCYNGTLDGTLTFLWTAGDNGKTPSLDILLCCRLWPPRR